MAAKLLAEWFWIDRWMGSSGFLLAVEPRGLYREMLTQAWRRGASLPNNHDEIRRATGTSMKEWRRCWPKVEPFWRVDGERLVNDTQLEIYAEAQGRQRRASERGLRGAQAKHKQRTSTTQAPLEHKPPSPSPITKKNKKEPSATEPPNPQVREFLNWFPSEYKTRRHGADYLVKWERDSPLVKAMLRTTPLERLKKLAIVMLSDKCDEPFIVETDRGIQILSTKFNWLSDRLAAWEARTRTA